MRALVVLAAIGALVLMSLLAFVLTQVALSLWEAHTGPPFATLWGRRWHARRGAKR